MKKYIRPTTFVVNVLHQCQILSGSDVVHTIDGNAGIGYGGEGGDNDEAHVKEYNFWGEEL